MLDKEAVKALQHSVGIQQASEAVTIAFHEQAPILGLPDHYEVHDLEKFQPTRRRARGVMATSSLAAFAEYTTAHIEKGTTVFVDMDAMSATAVLNLGIPEAPGHADNRAKFSAKATAAYVALRHIANGTGRKQVEIAEFLEDWPSNIKCFNDDGDITPPRAIAAVRKITIEALRKLESEEQSLSASRSAFESVAATSKEPLPTTIYFTCVPYVGLAERTFVLRLGVLTSGDKPSVVLRIVKAEEHAEEMGNELAALIADKFSNGDGDAPPVLLGSYTATT